MYYRQTWIDKRLSFLGTELSQLSVSNEMLSKIWWPDTFFANSKHTKFHDVTTKNAFLRIKNNGEIIPKLKVRTTPNGYIYSRMNVREEHCDYGVVTIK